MRIPETGDRQMRPITKKDYQMDLAVARKAYRDAVTDAALAIAREAVARAEDSAIAAGLAYLGSGKYPKLVWRAK